MSHTDPVCYQYINKCTVNNPDSFEGDVFVKPDSIVVTDIKSIPILLNLASTFGDNCSSSVHSDVPIHVIPASYKVGCGPKATSRFSPKDKERNDFLSWCHNNLKGVNVYKPTMKYCQAAYIQTLGASLSSQSVVMSSESFTSVFNGLGIFTVIESIPNLERLVLGTPLKLPRIKVIGVQLVGTLKRLTVSTDIVLHFIRFLRGRQLSGYILEVWGQGLSQIALSERIAISNMVKETSASCIFFPCDTICHSFLKSAKDLLFQDKKVKISKAPADVTIPRSYHENVTLDLGNIDTYVSGPKRESDRIPLSEFSSTFSNSIYDKLSPRSFGVKPSKETEATQKLHGTVVGLSLAGCTNSSNAFVTLQAALLARELLRKKLQLPSFIQGVYATGAGLADLYLQEAGLSEHLFKLGLTKSSSCCIDPNTITQTDKFSKDVVTCALMSGNGNYENRKHPGAKANYVMSSPLALLLATLGNVNIDITGDEIQFPDKSVKIADLWPDKHEMIALEYSEVLPKVCSNVFQDLACAFKDEDKRSPVPFSWDDNSLYILKPPYLDLPLVFGDVVNAAVLISLGDNITSEAISPAGSMTRNSTAAKYLNSRGLVPKDYDSYGNRRGNHHVVAMGVFNNNKLKNNLAPVSGPYTTHLPTNTVVDIYEASQTYHLSGTPTLILAGSNYGCGTTRDSGARGVRLLGVAAVVACSFHEPHRVELVQQGVTPVVCPEVDCVDIYSTVTITWSNVGPLDSLDSECTISWGAPSTHIACKEHTAVCCSGTVRGRLAVRTPQELEILRAGGLLGWRVKELEKRDQIKRENDLKKQDSGKQFSTPGFYLPPPIMYPQPVVHYVPYQPFLIPNTLPSSIPNNLPYAIPNILPNTLPCSIPNTLPNILPNTLPNILPNTLPNTLPNPHYVPPHR